MMNMLILSLLVNQVPRIFGKMIVVYGPENTYGQKYSERKYICLSDDDGSALVWNSDIPQSVNDTRE